VSFLSKWGFSRTERTAIVILVIALLIGSGISYLRQSALSQEAGILSKEDSILVYKLTEYTKSIADSQPSDSLVSEAVTKLPEKTIQYPIDINSATADELEALPGIGPVLAGRIIEYRQKYGPFAAPDSLLNIQGIGKTKLSKIISKITVKIPRSED